jgi:hypothetical protein
MKVTIGYGVRYPDEDLRSAARIYLDGSKAFNTKRGALDYIKLARKAGYLKKNEKATIFKFIVEEN